MIDDPDLQRTGFDAPNPEDPMFFEGGYKYPIKTRKLLVFSQVSECYNESVLCAEEYFAGWFCCVKCVVIVRQYVQIARDPSGFKVRLPSISLVFACR